MVNLPGPISKTVVTGILEGRSIGQEREGEGRVL